LRWQGAVVNPNATNQERVMPRESDPNAEQFDQDEQSPQRNAPREAVPDDGRDEAVGLSGRINPLVTKNPSIKNK
jgi:hypothetical protein